ncbi:MAG: cytochrome c, partial [Myxococcota bacterium]
ALAVPAFTVATDAATIEKGKAVFDARGCGACHQFGSKLVGPDLNGIAERRTPDWIAKMVKHPNLMVRQDPEAKKLLGELMVEMPNQGVEDAELGPLVSFLASHPAGTP